MGRVATQLPVGTTQPLGTAASTYSVEYRLWLHGAPQESTFFFAKALIKALLLGVEGMPGSREEEAPSRHPPILWGMHHNTDTHTLQIQPGWQPVIWKYKGKNKLLCQIKEDKI